MKFLLALCAVAYAADGDLTWLVDMENQAEFDDCIVAKKQAKKTADAVTGKCAGNGDSTEDVTCGTGKELIAAAYSTDGTDEATCCGDPIPTSAPVTAPTPNTCEAAFTTMIMASHDCTVNAAKDEYCYGQDCFNEFGNTLVATAELVTILTKWTTFWASSPAADSDEDKAMKAMVEGHTPLTYTEWGDCSTQEQSAILAVLALSVITTGDYETYTTEIGYTDQEVTDLKAVTAEVVALYAASEKQDVRDTSPATLISATVGVIAGLLAL